jgi:type I restriction enzyme, S subunit
MNVNLSKDSQPGNRWQRYPAYKDSDVDWLGKIPAHWGVKRLKYLVQRGLVNGLFKKKEHFGTGVKLVNVIDLYRDDFLIDFASLGRVEAEDTEVKAYAVTAGDIFFVRSSLKLEGVGASARISEVPEPTVFECHVVKVTPSEKMVSADYMSKFLNSTSARQRLIALSETTTMTTIAQPKLSSLEMPVPPPDEQQAIADFLNRETAKVDALIAKREQLIALLKEKRAALISHAVTKGLDPSVPTKESGIEWLGKIPAHWTSRRLRHISDQITVGVVVNPSSYVSDEGVPFLLGGDIREFCIDTSNCNRCTLETSSGPLGKSQLNGGDIVVVRVGYPGVAAVVPPDIQGANCASMMLVRKHPRFISQWLAYGFNSKVGRDQIDIVQYGAAQKQFNISHAVDFSFPFPPLEEQQAIADHLDRTRAKIGQMIAKMEAAVTCLQEYRTALISAAVTGKIDVRGEVQ